MPTTCTQLKKIFKTVVIFIKNIPYSYRGYVCKELLVRRKSLSFKQNFVLWKQKNSLGSCLVHKICTPPIWIVFRQLCPWWPPRHRWSGLLFLWDRTFYFLKTSGFYNFFLQLVKLLCIPHPDYYFLFFKIIDKHIFMSIPKSSIHRLPGWWNRLRRFRNRFSVLGLLFWLFYRLSNVILYLGFIHDYKST